MYKSEPKIVMISPSISPASKEKLDAAKIKNEIAKVNIMLVFELRLRCPSKFLLTTSLSCLSRLQHVFIHTQRKPFSTNSKISTDINVKPMIIITSRVSKINKNHSVF